MIEFMLNDFAGYKMALLELRHANDQIEATVEASPEVWEFIDLLQFFHLHWDARNQGTISGTKDVQVKIVLDKNIYESLKSSQQLLTDKTSFIDSPREHLMRSTQSWYALEVTEAIDLPEDMKSMGEVRSGFTTKWKDGLGNKK